MISSVGGNSGGPLCVQYQNGSYYPAAIYLGVTGQTVVRVIDSDMVDMFNRASVSANGGADNTGGGVTRSDTYPATQAGKGVLEVLMSPNGYHWGLSPGSYPYGLFNPQLESLTAGQLYTIYFQPGINGYTAPNPYSVTIVQNTKIHLSVNYGYPSAQAITFSLPTTRTVLDPPLTLNATATSALQVAYVVSGPAVLTGSNTLIPNGIGTVSVQAKHDGNASWAAAAPVTLTINITADTVTAWTARNFTIVEQTNSSISGPSADPNRNGIPNLIEFAFNMNPKSTSYPRLGHPTGTPGMPYISRNGSGFLVIEYIRRMASGNPGITYAVEFAGSSSGPRTVQPAESVSFIDTTFERVTVTDTAVSAQRFSRVRVTTN